MAQDVGIIVSQPGTSVSGASASQISLNTSNPFIKLDTQNRAGFQTLTLLITTDPPEPVNPATDSYTTLYKFKHGYLYIPSVETLFYVVTPPPGIAGGQTYFLDGGFLGGHTVDDGVYVYAVADTTWVYIICDKFNDQSGLGAANLLTGTTLQITTHVFVENGVA
jgi:hypothetical protein